MSFFWDSVKQTAEKAGTAAKIAGHKTKLRADIALIDRKITARKQQFGVDLYDFVAPLSKSPEFFAANDRMTGTVRGPFVKTDREIAALANRRVKLKEAIAQNEAAHAAAFPKQAANFGEQVLNAGKSAGYTSKGAKLKTDLFSVEAQMKGHKQEFGLTMFAILVELEDKEEWLPTVREIRTMYDQTRQDIEKLVETSAAKDKQLANLSLGGGTSSETLSINGTSDTRGGTLESWTDTGATVTMTPDPAVSSQVAPSARPETSIPVSDPFIAMAAPRTVPVVDPFASGTSMSGTGVADLLGASSAPSPAVPVATTGAAYDPFAVFDSVPAQSAPHHQGTVGTNPMFQY